MDTQLIRILKKLLTSQKISLQCLLKGDEKETRSSADYHLSVVRKKEEKVQELIKAEVSSSNEIIVVTEQEKGVEKGVQRKELLVAKKALVWDPRVQDGLLSANQLFNINQWLLSVENLRPDQIDGLEERDGGTTDQDDTVDSIDRMLDSFQDFGCNTKGRRLTTLVYTTTF